MSKSDVLYLKYRPQKFQEVRGQDHITRVLEGSMNQNKIGHAYLFSGERGTGKTTMARIFSRELGCSENDILEIDAASNRGIDDIRALRDGVYTLPFDSKYKVYIIDEVHMLTKEAFNALLKTLEEPPQHVIFILATTELHKVLPTIVSRCQSFRFNGPSLEELSLMVSGITESEGYSIDIDAVNLVAKLGKGSFRDTQTVLQKILSCLAPGNISMENVEDISSAPSSDLVISLVEALNTNDQEKGLLILKKVESKGINSVLFLSFVIDCIREVLLLRFSKQRALEISKTQNSSYFEKLQSLAEKKNRINASLLKEMINSEKYLHYAGHKYVALELAFFNDLGNND